MKTEYDLRGLKNRGEAHRKEIFVTAHNKQISINKEVSKRVADIARKGTVSILPNRRNGWSMTPPLKVVHKALEKELRPLVIPVIPKTREDIWGIR